MDCWTHTYLHCSIEQPFDEIEILWTLNCSFAGHPPIQAEILFLKAIKPDIHESITDVEDYLSLGSNEIPDKSEAYTLKQIDWVDIREEFCPRLLPLQRNILHWKRFLILWETDLCLVLSFLWFSEIQYRFCTQWSVIHWFIWPALLVLWGAPCMFHDNKFMRNWEEENFFTAISDSVALIDGSDYADPFTVLDFDEGDLAYNTDVFVMSESQLNSPILEQQQRPLWPDRPITSGKVSATSLTSIPSVIKAGELNKTPMTTLSGLASSLGGGVFQEASCTGLENAENGSLEVTGSESSILLSSCLINKQSLDEQAVSSRKSKHGQTEKYFCIYSECDRSQPGRGFNRKDHLDQHLRGVHKQSSVSRMRAKPTASETGNQVSPNETRQPSIQSKKRCHGSEGENGRCRGDSIFGELAEERRLRLLTDQENQRLRQKIENYEERMQKYEERLDRMMTLMESRSRDDKK